jgi:FkbM family methyltransferase
VLDGEREQFYDLASSFSSYISVNARGTVYLIRTKDQNVGRSLFLKQGRGEMRTLERAIALVLESAGKNAIEGRQFLDVGANIGTTTIPALIEHHFGTAICFEPEPQNLLTLRLNLLLNGLENQAQALGVAVSNVKGVCTLVVEPGESGKSWVAIDADKLDALTDTSVVTVVPTVTLDELGADGTIDEDAVALLWMDAQAHEGHILAGARRLAERGVPVVLEWDPQGLDQFGNRREIEQIAAERYTHFIDLRPNLDPGKPGFEVRPTAGLEDYSKPFLELGGRNFTDILLLQLDQGTAKRLDVPATLARYVASVASEREQRSSGQLAVRKKPG